MRKILIHVACLFFLLLGPGYFVQGNTQHNGLDEGTIVVQSDSGDQEDTHEIHNEDVQGAGHDSHNNVHTSNHEGGHEGGMEPLLFIIIALIIGAATRHFLKKSPLPFTVTLLLIGIVLGVMANKGLFDGVMKPFELGLQWA